VTVKVIIEVTCLIRQEEQNGLMISRNKYLGTNNDLTSTTIAQLRVVTTCLQCALHDNWCSFNEPLTHVCIKC